MFWNLILIRFLEIKCTYLRTRKLLRITKRINFSPNTVISALKDWITAWNILNNAILKRKKEVKSKL